MKRTLCLLFLLGTVGCAHEMYSVSADEDAGGVPFLPFESIDVVTISHAQDWYEVAVSAEVVPPGTKPEDYAKAKFGKSVVLFTESEASAATVLDAFNREQTAEAAFKKADDALHATGSGFSGTQPALRDPRQPNWDKGLKLLGVTRTRTQAPAAEPRYLNSLVPIGGTASGSVQLGSNGTLSQAEANVQDQLPGAIATSLTGIASTAITGYTGLLTEKVSAAKSTLLTAPPAAPHTVAAKITLTPIRRTYKVTIEASSLLGERACAQQGLADLLQGNVAGNPKHVCRASLAVAVSRDSEPSDAGEGDANANAVQVKGTISLPKGAAK